MALMVSEEKCSKIRTGVCVYGSKQISSSWIMWGPPFKFRKIEISQFIFAYRTGFKILITIFLFFSESIPSNTSEYLPLPKGLIIS